MSAQKNAPQKAGQANVGFICKPADDEALTLAS